MPVKTAKKRRKSSRKSADSGIDMTLVKAISHPDRVLALNILNERVASPTELARELNVPVNYIAYHVRQLEKYDCVELVKTAPRRGATEHWYRATRRGYFRDEEWMRVPLSLREPLVRTVLTKLGEDVSTSIDDGKFEGRADRHCTHTSGLVDEEGWSEVQDLLTEMLERYLAIQAASRERSGDSDEPMVRMGVSLIGFEMGGDPD